MRRRFVVVVGAASLLLLCAGCGSHSPSMLDARSADSGRISHLWWLMFGLAVVVYIGVMAVVALAMLRRRRERGDAPDDPSEVIDVVPSARDDRRFLLYGGLALPIVVLSIIAVQTVRVSNALQAGAPTVRIDVDAKDWWWRISYPNDGGVVTANEIHVPVGEPVDLSLRSDNVIHSVWVPQLNGKTDVVPGQTNHLTFTADVPGTYRGECAEFCGIQHAQMGFVVVVQSQADYTAWLAANRAPAVAPATPQEQAGAQLLATTSCAGCHTITGTDAAGILGPDLTHVGSRSMIAADALPNTPAGMTEWLSNTQGVKDGALMPQIDLTTEQVADLVAYLEALT